MSNEGTRGGTGTQQTGWGARQQAVRLSSRAEADNRGESQQAGNLQTDAAKPKNKRPPRS
ncbi:hypothetical protein ACHMW6_16555 [Pseudoduganella sp. UC29_106]|uniref:hypothetical protein n=1 Tax=Pseudoduganella sp. UC29_106 TaxID=3374553 RepID=UPI0037569BCC